MLQNILMYYVIYTFKSLYLWEVSFRSSEQWNAAISRQANQICRHVELSPSACVQGSEERRQLIERWRKAHDCDLNHMTIGLVSKLLQGGCVTASACCVLNFIWEHVVQLIVVCINFTFSAWRNLMQWPWIIWAALKVQSRLASVEIDFTMNLWKPCLSHRFSRL